MTILIPLLPYLKPSVLSPMIFLQEPGTNQAGSFDSRRAHARGIIVHVFDMTREVYDMDKVVCTQTDFMNLAPAKAGIRW